MAKTAEPGVEKAARSSDAPAGETGAGAVEPAEAAEAAAAPIFQGAEAMTAAIRGAFSPAGQRGSVTDFNQALIDRARAIATEYASWASQSLERQAKGMSELMACRTPAEMLEVQNRMIRDNVEALIATNDRTTRLTTTALSGEEKKKE